MSFTPLQKLPNNVGDLVKIFVAKGFEWLPKVQKIAKSGHTASQLKFQTKSSSKQTNRQRTNLLCKGTFLLYSWFGFSKTSPNVNNLNVTKRLNPNGPNRRSSVPTVILPPMM